LAFKIVVVVLVGMVEEEVKVGNKQRRVEEKG
jgi:hypothetical protein